jgi:hypothetical protein
VTGNYLRRAALVTASAVVMAVGTLAGFGLLGTAVEDTAGGAFSADATLVTPAVPAFSIWSVIYLLLLGYVGWLWFAPNRRRGVRVAWLAAVSMLLNALWLVVTQLGWVWVSVAVIAALAVDLGLLVRRLAEERPASWLEALLVDGTFGIYLGWVSVASVANVTAAVVASSGPRTGTLASLCAVLVLAVAGALGAVYATRLGGRWGIALAMAWALSWIAVGRIRGPLDSTAAASAAVVAAIAVLVVTALARRIGPVRPVATTVQPLIGGQA